MPGRENNVKRMLGNASPVRKPRRRKTLEKKSSENGKLARPKPEQPLKRKFARSSKQISKPKKQRLH